MTPDEYVKLAVNTESKPNTRMRVFASEFQTLRLLHAVMGMGTEAGEAEDVLKRHIFYGTELDIVTLKEEVGDMLWYCALLCDALDASMEEIMKTNIKKLAARYPDKFKEHDAVIRDLNKEREILEGNDNG